jgi:predicted nucleotidyltransferase
MSDSEKEVLSQIQAVIRQSAPEATAILYGSRARGDARPDSDWDILILLDKERITHEDRERIAHPLYDLAIDISEDISVKLRTEAGWEERSFTLFYKHIKEEGLVLYSPEEVTVLL